MAIILVSNPVFPCVLLPHWWRSHNPPYGEIGSTISNNCVPSDQQRRTTKNEQPRRQRQHRANVRLFNLN